MKKILFFFLMPFIVNAQEIKQNEIINPKGNWYFGAEAGLNTISSFYAGGTGNSFQSGIVAEYYSGKHWSVMARIKYFETGLSFVNNSYDYFGPWPSKPVSALTTTSGSNYGIFHGAVIAVPINVKWEFRMKNNLRGNLKLGLAYNYELKSDYNFSSNLTTNNPRSFGSLNAGFGFSYFVSKKMTIYLDFETYQLGSQKGPNNSGGGFIDLNPFDNNYTTNNLFNMGVKYSFKK